MRYRKFNYEKELRKLKYKRNKGKYAKIFMLFSWLIIGFIVGLLFTKLRYEYSGVLQPINSKVDSFTYKEYIIASYINGEETMTIPTKNADYLFDHVECDSDATGKWDNKNWELVISNATKRTRCTLYFVTSTEYRDGVIASPPELYDGLIAVTYDEAGNVIVADTSKGWYDYANHEWANAVLVNHDLNKTYDFGSSVG